VSGLNNGFSNSVFRSRLYKLALMGRGPTTLAALPPDSEERGVATGDAESGRAIMNGGFTIAGKAVDFNTAWPSADAADQVQVALHRFDWLGDLAVLDSIEARRFAEFLFESWDERYGTYHEVSWRADILAARMVNWLTQYAALFEPAEATFRIRFLDSIARQLRHLRRVASQETAPMERIEVLKGLIYGEACVTSETERVRRSLTLLEAELERQVLPDGSHISRSPGRQLATLEALIDIRAVLTAASREVPVALRNTIDRMAPMTRFLRHSDGALACFNGGGRPNPTHVSRVLLRSDAQGRAPGRAPYAGFERIDANGMVLILDGGTPPEDAFDEEAHAGLMSFEMSVDGQRLIVNCGAGADTDAGWRQALRTTAAHSTVIIDDRNSCEVTETGLGRRPGAIDCDRGEIDGNIWISSSHDGYEDRYGLTHRRRLYVGDEEPGLRGEDILVGDRQHPFAVRFHLHPAVRAVIDGDPGSATLTLPNGDRWRLRADRPIALEDSVYWEDGSGIERSTQIVVRGETKGAATPVKWRLRQLAQTGGTEFEAETPETTENVEKADIPDDLLSPGFTKA
jgi:uncharacterized heparinase superfamily protein